MIITLSCAARLLENKDNIVIFTHRNPDGDAIGSSFALLYALEAMGKKARIECADALIYGRFAKVFGEYSPVEFNPDFLVSVDTASLQMLSGAESRYGMEIGLCIDHHRSNTLFAEQTLLDADASAAAEVVYRLLGELGIVADKRIANAVYTGVATDTGCFRNSNTTAGAHLTASAMISAGADSAYINRLLFDTKSRGRLAVDKHVLDTITYHFDGLCAVIFLAHDITAKIGVEETELDGISAFPRTVEGVIAGVTIRGNPDDTYRVSLRTHSPADASRICAEFEGGGHKNAAGCTLTGESDAVRAKILGAVERELALHNLL